MGRYAGKGEDMGVATRRERGNNVEKVMFGNKFALHSSLAVVHCAIGRGLAIDFVQWGHSFPGYRLQS